ncbi:MAG TPA: hypothetical protein VGC42_28780, partial [Kofleriaceae bacterium]
DDCVVTETTGGVQAELGKCSDGAAAPCWRLYTDVQGCPAGDHVGIAVDRGATTAPAGATLTARCYGR